MRKINLVKIVAILGMLTFASCQKEKMDLHEESSFQSYPDEITLDNWEQFVHAPQSVIDYHTKKEIKLNNRVKNSNRNLGNETRSLTKGIFGHVIAHDGTWNDISGVVVTYGMASGTTNQNGIYLITNTSAINNICMSYSTNVRNGVSTLDLILIQRHILHIVPFTEARQFIAADVNGDGSINASDLIDLRKVILGKLSIFPSGNNVLFITNTQYAFAHNNLTANGTIIQPILQILSNFPNCVSGENDRTMIKVGDVNGSFVF
jgi:hypothetical protein